MGALAQALARFTGEQKQNIGMAIPTWESGVPQYANTLGAANFLRYAREGYGQNEIIYACIEELATSAAEPRLAVYQQAASGPPRKITAHPVLDLFERPNPFMDRYCFVASIIMYLQIAGNVYIHKERGAAGAGRVVELWLLRPDRVRVIPDARTHIGGYEYRLGDQLYTLPPTDVIHLRTRNPMDDWYGLPPLGVVAARADTDNWARSFVRAFFTNAGVPAGLLNITRQVNDAERELIRSRFRSEYGGPAGWHNLLVLDNTEATFTAMGQSLGQRGLVLPELDEMHEARIAMAFGVPLELIGARLGMIHGNRSTTREARASFWDETLVPLYRMLAAGLQMGMADELGYDGYDTLDFDLTTVQALQEDADALMKRAVEGYAGGVLQRGEARKMVGQKDTPDDGVYFMPRSAGLIDPDETLVPGGAAPELVGTPPPDPAAVAAVAGRVNGAAHGVANGVSH